MRQVLLVLVLCCAATSTLAQSVEQRVDAAVADSSGALAMLQQTLAAMRNQIKSDQAQIADLQKQLADAKAAKEAPKP